MSDVDEDEKPYRLEGEGDVRNGRKEYSCLYVRLQKIVVGDSVFICSGGDKDFVGRVKVFHQNLTDQRVYADIVWLYRPKELRSKVNRKDTHLVSESAENEVFFSDDNGTIEVPTIRRKAHIVTTRHNKLPPKILGDNSLVAKFSFSSKTKRLSPLLSERLGSPSGKVHKCVGAVGQTSPSTGYYSDSSHGAGTSSKATTPHSLGQRQRHCSDDRCSRDAISDGGLAMHRSPRPKIPDSHSLMSSPLSVVSLLPTKGPRPQYTPSRGEPAKPENWSPCPIVSDAVVGGKRVAASAGRNHPRTAECTGGGDPKSNSRPTRNKGKTIPSKGPSLGEKRRERLTVASLSSPRDKQRMHNLSTDELLHRLSGSDTEEEEEEEEEEKEEEEEEKEEEEEEDEEKEEGEEVILASKIKKRPTRSSVGTGTRSKTDDKVTRIDKQRSKSSVQHDHTNQRSARLGGRESCCTSHDTSKQVKKDCETQNSFSVSRKRTLRKCKSSDKHHQNFSPSEQSSEHSDFAAPTPKRRTATRDHTSREAPPRTASECDADFEAPTPKRKKKTSGRTPKPTPPSDSNSNFEAPARKRPVKRTPKAGAKTTPTKSRGSRPCSLVTPVRSVRGRSRVGTPLGKAVTPHIPLRSKVRSGGAARGGKKDPYELAREKLHVSVIPDSLPCREGEFADICSFVEGKLLDGTGGCMYISGVPGTGKTATVMEVARSLRDAMEKGDLPEFQFVDINGMRLTEPRQAFSAILKQLTGEHATPDHASSLLDKYFSGNHANRKTTLLLADELDLLWTRKQRILYSLFDWPTRQHAKLVVLAVANTMDLPERVMLNRVSSRLGLTRLTFQPYSFEQLREIVSSRLTGLQVFKRDAIELAARKVAAVSGDARRALDISRRATELALQHQGASQSGSKRSTSELVGMDHVSEAIQEMFSSAKVQAVRYASLYEKLFLKAVISRFRRSGLEEATVKEVHYDFTEICRSEGNKPLSLFAASEISSRLFNSRLILEDNSRLGVYRKVRLNITLDDVIFALRNSK